MIAERTVYSLKKFSTVLTFAVLILIQFFVSDSIQVFGVAPNLMLTFVIIYSVNNEIYKAAIAGCVYGLFLDATGAWAIGYNALLMMYTAALVASFSGRFFYENKLAIIITVFALSFLFEFVKVSVSNALFGDLPVFYVTGRYILPECIYNSIAALLLVPLADRIKYEYIRGI